MAINQNHPFEDLDGVKCAVVERNVPADRVAFLKDILETNGFTVVVAASPPPKGAPAPEPGAEPVTPATFTLGVTDVAFNTINALFGRLLHTRDGHVVTNDYWYQRSSVSDDSTPYFVGK